MKFFWRRHLKKILSGLMFTGALVLGLTASVNLIKQRQTLQSQASKQVSLSLEPTQSQVVAKNSFAVNLILDPQELNVTAAQVEIEITPDKTNTGFTVDSVKLSDSLPVKLTDVDLIAPNIDEDQNDNNFVITFTLGANPDKLLTTSQAIAKINLTAGNQPGTITFKLTSNTQVAALGRSDNVYPYAGEATAINIVKSLSDSKPSPSPTKKASPSPTPSTASGSSLIKTPNIQTTQIPNDFESLQASAVDSEAKTPFFATKTGIITLAGSGVGLLIIGGLIFFL